MQRKPKAKVQRSEPQLELARYKVIVSVQILEVASNSDSIREEFTRFALAGHVIRRDLTFPVAQELMQRTLDYVRKGVR